MAYLFEQQERLYTQIDRWFDRSRAALLGEVPCRRGCCRCCIGPFAITISDAEMLQKGLAQQDPGTCSDIQHRAKVQAATIEREFPRLASSSLLDDWSDSDVDQLVRRFADLPCPALDSNGSCLLYLYRPATCRAMGLPVQAGTLVHGACDVQVMVPIVPLPRRLREEEDRLAEEESAVVAQCMKRSAKAIGEEMLLPYGFLSDRTAEQQLNDRPEF